MSTIKAWHFAANNKKLMYDDNRPVRRNVRYFARPKGNELELRRHGMHGSKNILDALQWAPGNVITWCEFGGQIIQDDDKLVAEWRKPLWVYDATELLLEFTRWCALQVSHLWECPDVVKQFLETGDKTLREKANRATRIGINTDTIYSRAARAATMRACIGGIYTYACNANATYAFSDAIDAFSDAFAATIYARNAVDVANEMKIKQEQKLIEMLTSVGWEK